jgi:hypothetical protein
MHPESGSSSAADFVTAEMRAGASRGVGRLVEKRMLTLFFPILIAFLILLYGV